jgi:hypothetical protein
MCYYLKSTCNTQFVKIDDEKVYCLDLASNFNILKESIFSIESIDYYNAEELANFTAHLTACERSDSEGFSIMERLEKLFSLAKVHSDERNE